jgi:predicted ribosome quality control (RQC) complex YloA/Tae2 family protein
MIIDSGFRCHLTNFSRATAASPSPFVARLRKFLKTRRVTAVSQIGTDRIIEFQFSDGQYRMFLEFYAGGNIILTDKELGILALLRTVAEGEGQEELRVGLKYTLENRQNYGGIPPLTRERLQKALQKAVDKAGDDLVAGKKQKKVTADALRKALAVSVIEYPPLLVDHSMHVTGFDATLKPAEVLGSESLMEQLMLALDEAKRVVQEITSSETAKGYIIAKQGQRGPEPSANVDVATQKNLIYDDFHPFRPRQFEDDPTCSILAFDGFNKTVDEFFSSIEGQRLESRLHEREITAKKKLEAARQDQTKRLGGLQEVQELNIRKAGAIEANIERIQEAMDAVNSLIASGKDWVEIAKLIEYEQKRQNPVADIIHLPLQLEKNTITLLLGEEEAALDGDNDSAYATDSDVSDIEDDATKEESTGEAESRLKIDINLGISPWSNAREYYDQKRSAATKEVKTARALTKALKSQEQKIAQDLKKGLKQEKAILRPVRQQMWFEKFIWFVSSDGYLVLGGRDAQQNEILYKKYLRKGDVSYILKSCFDG